MENVRKGFKRAVLTILLFAVLTAVMASPYRADCHPPLYAADKYVEGEALVVLRNGIGTLNAASISSAAGKSYVNSVAASAEAEVPVVYDALSAARGKFLVLMRSETKSTKELIAELEKNPNVLNASPNYRVRTLSRVIEPNDPLYKDGSLWGLKRIRAPEAWAAATGNEKVHVAVIDTGIDPEHEDLADNLDTRHSLNFTTTPPDKNYNDALSHGTHVAGTIAAVGSNGRGVVGVNWRAKIIALKVFHDGHQYDDRIIAALDHIARLLKDDSNLVLPAVNLSLGSWYPVIPEKMEGTAYWEAYKALDETNRIVIVTAAGNSYRQVGAPATHENPQGYDPIAIGDYCYPASFTGLDNMIVVGGINIENDASLFTNWSSEAVHVVAPGGSLGAYNENILSTVPGGAYNYKTGTSMAAPHVAGAVALLAARRADQGLLPLPASTLKWLITSTASSDINPMAPAIDLDLDPPVRIPHQSPVTDTRVSKHGLLDVKAAMDALDKLRGRSSGGCDAGVGLFALAALAVLMAMSKGKRAR